MLSCGLMTNALSAAGASPELIAIFLAQSGAYEQENADKKFGGFLAKRLAYPDADKLLSVPRVIMALGPSGVGKTTLLAQMIARLRMSEPNARVTLVNAHSTRFGAAEDLRNNEDVKEFYLGMGGGERKSFKDVKSYKRRKRWLA